MEWTIPFSQVDIGTTQGDQQLPTGIKDRCIEEFDRLVEAMHAELDISQKEQNRTE
jgi:hypothetical protein